MNPAVFLDRDNTLIANDGDLGDPSEVILLCGVSEGLAKLKGLGYKLLVVSNQGGVARGKYSEEDVRRVHQRLSRMIDEHVGASGVIDGFYFCPFHPEGAVPRYCREHPWRKPQPGMILAAANEHDVDLQQSWLIGDQLRDMEAGHAAGCRTILLTPTDGSFHAAPSSGLASAGDFSEAVSIITSERLQDAG